MLLLLFLGIEINDSLLPDEDDIQKQFQVINNELRPENLEHAVEIGENDEPSIKGSSKSEAPQGSLSYTLWQEMQNELVWLQALYQKLQVKTEFTYSAAEVIKLTKHLETRVRNLYRAIEPRFNVVKVTNTNKVPQTHHVIRAYWFDVNGNEKRSVNKVYYNVESDYVKRTVTLLEENGYTVLSSSKSNVRRILKGDKKFSVELEEQNCLKLFARYSMWNHYKDEYKLK